MFLQLRPTTCESAFSAWQCETVQWHLILCVILVSHDQHHVPVKSCYFEAFMQLGEQCIFIFCRAVINDIPGAPRHECHTTLTVKLRKVYVLSYTGTHWHALSRNSCARFAHSCKIVHESGLKIKSWQICLQFFNFCHALFLLTGTLLLSSSRL